MTVSEPLEEGKIYKDDDGTLLVAVKAKTCKNCYFANVIAGRVPCHTPSCEDYIFKKVKSILIKKKENDSRLSS